MKPDALTDFDIRNTAGYKLAQQIERNNEFFRRQEEKKRKDSKNAKERPNSH